MDKPSAVISIVAACFFVLAVAFVWGEILTINNIAVLGLMDFNDFVSAALLAGSFFLPMVALGLILLLVFGGAKYFANWEQVCPPALTMCPIFVVCYTGFYFITEQWPWGTLVTPALAIIVGYGVWAVIRSVLSSQRNHLVYAWAPAIAVAFSAMVAQAGALPLAKPAASNAWRYSASVAIWRYLSCWRWTGARCWRPIAKRSFIPGTRSISSGFPTMPT